MCIKHDVGKFLHSMYSTLNSLFNSWNIRGLAHVVSTTEWKYQVHKVRTCIELWRILQWSNREKNMRVGVCDAGWVWSLWYRVKQTLSSNAHAPTSRWLILVSAKKIDAHSIHVYITKTFMHWSLPGVHPNLESCSTALHDRKSWFAYGTTCDRARMNTPRRLSGYVVMYRVSAQAWSSGDIAYM